MLKVTTWENGLFELRKELVFFLQIIRPVAGFSTTLKKSPLKEAVVKGTDFCDLQRRLYWRGHFIVAIINKPDDGPRLLTLPLFTEKRH